MWSDKLRDHQCGIHTSRASTNRAVAANRNYFIVQASIFELWMAGTSLRLLYPERVSLEMQRCGSVRASKHFNLTTHMQKHSPHHRCAGVQARCKINGYRQLKGGLKGGLIPSSIINALIYDIFMMDGGAPTQPMVP